MAKWGKFEIRVKPSFDDLVVNIEVGEDGNVWMTKAEIAHLFEVFYSAVSSNIKVMLKSGDLSEDRHVKVTHYKNKKGQECSNELFNLEAAIALGFKMKGYKCRLFRQWVARQLSTPNSQKQFSFFIQTHCNGMKN